MTRVTRTYYEIVGDGLEIAAAHYAKCDERHRTGFEIAQRHGAKGYRPSLGRGIIHLIFEDGVSPDGFTRVQKEPQGLWAWKPDRRTAAGKAIAKEFAAYEAAPHDDFLISDLGAHLASYPTDGRSIHFPTAIRVALPNLRYFVSIPREIGDGWSPPAVLKEVMTSEVMAAIEAHNAIARERKAGGEGA